MAIRDFEDVHLLRERCQLSAYQRAVQETHLVEVAGGDGLRELKERVDSVIKLLLMLFLGVLVAHRRTESSIDLVLLLLLDVGAHFGGLSDDDRRR